MWAEPEQDPELCSYNRSTMNGRTTPRSPCSRFAVRLDRSRIPLATLRIQSLPFCLASLQLGRIVANRIRIRYNLCTRLRVYAIRGPSYLRRSQDDSYLFVVGRATWDSIADITTRKNTTMNRMRNMRINWLLIATAIELHLLTQRTGMAPSPRTREGCMATSGSGLKSCRPRRVTARDGVLLGGLAVGG